MPTGKNKKAIGLMKDELGGRIMTEFVELRPKTYACQIDDYNDDDDDDDDNKLKEAKGTKKCVIKRELKFNNYKDCLLNNKVVLKSQQRFKSAKHDIYTENVNKITLSPNDNKRLSTFDKITTYPYGTNVGKVCKTELLNKLIIK